MVQTQALGPLLLLDEHRCNVDLRPQTLVGRHGWAGSHMLCLISIWFAMFQKSRVGI